LFLHLGKNVIINLDDIIAIIDLPSAAGSSDTVDFIRTAREEGFVIKITGENPKSMIITEKAGCRNNKKGTGNSSVYFSPISSSTLSRRAGFLHSISEL
jgi:hypothetical protein